MSLAPAYAAAVATYNYDETSGNAIAQTGGQDLSETGTVGTTTGKFTNARVFDSSPEAFTHADNAVFEIGDTDWFATVWIYIDSSIAVDGAVICKGSGGDWGYFLTYRNGTGKLQWQVYASSGFGGGAMAESGVITEDAWHLVCVKHSATNNAIGISVDGAAFTTTAHSTGVYNSAGSFIVGLDEFSDQLKGRIDDLVIGTGYEFTDADASALWNSGTGVQFASWNAGPAGHPASKRMGGVNFAHGLKGPQQSKVW